MALDVLILILGGIAVAVALLGALIVMDRHRRAHQERLQNALPARHIAAQQQPAKKRREASEARAEDAIGRVLGRLDTALIGAGFRASAGECLAQFGMAVLVLYAAVVLGLGMNPVMAVPLAIMAPAVMFILILRIARGRRMVAFTAGLPEALDVFARGLKAGRPVADSLSIVIENAPEPVRSELLICHGQICLGTGLADAFTDLARRMPTPEANFFGVATALQTETGGNLVETMENLATQLRDRRKLKQKARALSSEARASAVILASLPFAVGCVILFLNASYLEPLISDSRGRVMLSGGLISIVLGIFMMMRMGRLDV